VFKPIGFLLTLTLSAVALGLCVLLAWKPPIPVAMGIVGAFAVYHGYAHGAELPENTSAITYSAGFVVATGCLHGVGICLGELRRIENGDRILRAAGAAVALAGTWFLYGSVS